MSVTLRRNIIVALLCAGILYSLWADGIYAFVYYTFWTLCLQLAAFLEIVWNDKYTILSFASAPIWTVFIAFWVVVRPHLLIHGKPPLPTHDIIMFFPHGVNVLLLLSEPPQYRLCSPIPCMVYNTIYVISLLLYHHAGGRDSAGDVVYEALDFDIWYNNILVLLGIPLVGFIHFLGAYQQKMAMPYSILDKHNHESSLNTMYCYRSNHP